MKQGYERVCAALHIFNCRLCLALLLLLLASQIAVVILRYCFGIGFLELQDFSAYVFASLVMLGIPVAYAVDRHVRVDVWREHQSLQQRCRIDRVGIVMLLLPVFAMSVYWVYPDVAYAWEIREGARETGGLGGVYLVKTVFPVSCLLMMLQGVRVLIVGSACLDVQDES